MLKFQIMIQPSIIGYFDTKDNIVKNRRNKISQQYFKLLQ